ncbi:DUF2231 domain-containing protein [Actinokineospora bangkokensis]|uniref:DUF2231 domain-containing protein n=1 Tax=Actinokineospora bangkokensis TaxID=1193682 RepID=A0A1Q9LP88_9PSEU|nr:DUF2231 domain-containing protein [Actinokineospora bangkokensis]OLR93840.1 hypothetical protein BJP25_16585 [Actinokineospora bangkokensis]
MNDLPLHPLVVHGVVVLVPLSVLGAVVIALWPAARQRFGWLVVAFAAAAAVLTPIAANSGETLQAALPDNELIREHAELGDTLIFFVAPLFLVLLALMLVDRAARRGAGPADEPAAGGGTATRVAAPTWTKPALIVAAVLSIALGVAAGVQVYRVGDAGAKAVWDGVGVEAGK